MHARIPIKTGLRDECRIVKDGFVKLDMPVVAVRIQY